MALLIDLKERECSTSFCGAEFHNNTGFHQVLHLVPTYFFVLLPGYILGGIQGWITAIINSLIVFFMATGHNYPNRLCQRSGETYLFFSGFLWPCPSPTRLFCRVMICLIKSKEEPFSLVARCHFRQSKKSFIYFHFELDCC